MSSLLLWVRWAYDSASSGASHETSVGHKWTIFGLIEGGLAPFPLSAYSFHLPAFQATSVAIFWVKIKEGRREIYGKPVGRIRRISDFVGNSGMKIVNPNKLRTNEWAGTLFNWMAVSSQEREGF